MALILRYRPKQWKTWTIDCSNSSFCKYYSQIGAKLKVCGLLLANSKTCTWAAAILYYMSSQLNFANWQVRMWHTVKACGTNNRLAIGIQCHTCVYIAWVQCNALNASQFRTPYHFAGCHKSTNISIQAPKYVLSVGNLIYLKQETSSCEDSLIARHLQEASPANAFGETFRLAIT